MTQDDNTPPASGSNIEPQPAAKQRPPQPKTPIEALPNRLAGLSREQIRTILVAEVQKDPTILEDPKVIRMAISMKEHRGPLPPPEDIAEYEEVCSGGADRIIAMAEKQQLHMHAIQTQVVIGNFKEARLGQILGFTLGFVGLAGAIACILLDHGITGTILGSSSLVALVAVFLKGRSQEQDPAA